jgi:hypothetical protein
LPCFLGSGHWIGGTNFSRLIGSNAAVAAVGLGKVKARYKPEANLLLMETSFDVQVKIRRLCQGRNVLKANLLKRRGQFTVISTITAVLSI